MRLRSPQSGDSFIWTGADDAWGEDLHVTRAIVPALPPFLGLIALTRTTVPELIKEARQDRAT